MFGRRAESQAQQDVIDTGYLVSHAQEMGDAAGTRALQKELAGKIAKLDAIRDQNDENGCW